MVCLAQPFMPKADLSNYKGREQAYVKHYLLERYLPDWGFKVGSKWEALVYVDGFAGPWETTDPNYADSSFAVAIDALRRCRLGLQSRGIELSVSAVLVENDPDAFAKLDSFVRSNPEPEVSITHVRGRLVDTIPQINQLVRNAGRRVFKFVLLDPKGWADIPMQKLQPFLNTRSCEVLITLMTKHINRFLNEENRATSYNNLFGRKGVLENLQNAIGDERTELAVKEYCRSLQLSCGFRFVSSAVILEPEEAQIRYFLVYATNHSRGVEVFRAAENKAAEVQEIIRHEMYLRKTGKENQGALFDDGPPVSSYAFRLLERYRNRARAKVLASLKNAPRSTVPNRTMTSLTSTKSSRHRMTLTLSAVRYC
jgi:three-Cys-motif partner protein